MPDLDLAAVARHDTLDVRGELALRFCGTMDLFRPVRHRAVPHERVAAHCHPVRHGELQHLIGLVEIVLLPRRVHLAPIEAAFRGDLLAIGQERGAVVDLGRQSLGAHAGAIGDARAPVVSHLRPRIAHEGSARDRTGNLERGRKRLSARQHFLATSKLRTTPPIRTYGAFRIRFQGAREDAFVNL
jgi:hypothetical protein